MGSVYRATGERDEPKDPSARVTGNPARPSSLPSVAELRKKEKKAKRETYRTFVSCVLCGEPSKAYEALNRNKNSSNNRLQ